MKAGWIIIKTKIDNSQFKKDLDRLKTEISGKSEGLGKKISSGISKGLSAVANIGKKIIGTIAGVVGGILSTIGTIIKSLVLGIGRIALASIGISTALGAVGVIAGLAAGAFKRIVENNQELLANLKYIVFVIGNAFYNASAGLATMIANAIAKIINLLAKVIVYTAYIIKAWFGIDILANSSVGKFKEASAGASDTAKGLGKAAKNAKELKKQLAGFDEMNVLQDNNTNAGGGAGGGGIGGGAGGLADPTLDLSKLQGDIPAWIKWIAENKDLVIAGLLGIAAGIAAVALGYNVLVGLGIGLAVAGIVLLVQDILTFIQDPSWENFGNIIRDLGIILAGIAITMIAINAANPLGWILLVIAAIAVLVGAVIKNWDKVKAILGTIGDWIMENVINPVITFFTDLWNKITEIFSPIVEFFKPILQTLVDTIKVIVGTIVNVVGTIWTNIKTMVENIKTIVNFIKNSIIAPIVKFISDKINEKITQFRAFFTLIKSIFEPLKPFFQGIINFIGGLLKKIGSTAGNVIAGAFKGVVNAILVAIETVLNSPIRSINNLIGVINEVPGISLKKLSTFKFPRLAKGGIINQPGRGVMIGGAIAGERGAEGVIPLTDSQQMALLGEAIGKYITVNASITNTMNGRVISRELQKINNESDFAFNR